MNELQPQQEVFNYFALDADVALEARAAAERIKIRLRRTAEDIVEIGRELIEIKNRLTHGQFLPWVASEFQMSDRTANNFMRVATRFKSEIIADFNPTVLYQLAAPSTPDEVIEKATEKAESGEKVSVEDVKRWKAEAEQAREQAKELQICAMQNQAKAESLRESLEAAQQKIDELNQEPRVEIREVEKEVVPADYHTTRCALDRANLDVAELTKQIKILKQKQAQEVAQGVQDAIKLHEAELKDMENRRDLAERRLSELHEHIDMLGQKASVHEWHAGLIRDAEKMLVSFSVELSEFDYIPETHDKWLKLAKNFRDAGQAIELLIAEKSGRSLDDRTDTCCDNAA
ncbi:MAG TPA: DUF3102 domain-containing protein [Candidatus Rifleibacterium sp.]|nr:DUF3102 domain-containing protein [Candidatus Rifleibacterium sp.]